MLTKDGSTPTLSSLYPNECSIIAHQTGITFTLATLKTSLILSNYSWTISPVINTNK